MEVKSLISIKTTIDYENSGHLWYKLSQICLQKLKGPCQISSYFWVFWGKIQLSSGHKVSWFRVGWKILLDLIFPHVGLSSMLFWGKIQLSNGHKVSWFWVGWKILLDLIFPHVGLSSMPFWSKYTDPPTSMICGINFFKMLIGIPFWPKKEFIFHFFQFISSQNINFDFLFPYDFCHQN